MTGLCVKCGRRLPIAQAPDPTRDLEYENAFLTDALEMALRVSGISNYSYPAAVYHRLNIGRERYGDGNYLTKDNLQEVREETPDIAAYAVLELQKQQRLGLNPEVLAELRLDLVAAAAYGAIADYFAQRASLLLRGEE
jgi:hypothetical protein